MANNGPTMTDVEKYDGSDQISWSEYLTSFKGAAETREIPWRNRARWLADRLKGEAGNAAQEIMTEIQTSNPMDENWSKARKDEIGKIWFQELETALNKHSSIVGKDVLRRIQKPTKWIQRILNFSGPMRIRTRRTTITNNSRRK